MKDMERVCRVLSLQTAAQMTRKQVNTLQVNNL